MASFDELASFEDEDEQLEHKPIWTINLKDKDPLYFANLSE